MTNRFKTTGCTSTTFSSLTLDFNKFTYDRSTIIIPVKPKQKKDDDEKKSPKVDDRLRYPYPSKLVYDNTSDFIFKKQIACGGNGCVYLYTDSKDNTIALKVTNDSVEVDMVKDLEGCTTCDGSTKHGFKTCNIVQCRYLDQLHDGKQPIYFLLLPKMDGAVDETDIYDWKLIEHLKFILFCVYEFGCLYKRGLVYTDIKLANLLYKCTSKGVLEIVLGDIGSIIHKGDTGAMYTYPYCMTTSERGANDDDIVWGLCIMWCMLYDTQKGEIDKDTEKGEISSVWHWAEIVTPKYELSEKETRKRIKVMLAKVDQTFDIVAAIQSIRYGSENKQYNKLMKDMMITLITKETDEAAEEKRSTRSNPTNKLDYFFSMIATTLNMNPDKLGYTQKLKCTDTKSDFDDLDNYECGFNYIFANKDDATFITNMIDYCIKTNKYQYLFQLYKYSKNSKDKKMEYIDYAIKNRLFNLLVTLTDIYTMKYIKGKHPDKNIVDKINNIIMTNIPVTKVKVESDSWCTIM